MKRHLLRLWDGLLPILIFGTALVTVVFSIAWLFLGQPSWLKIPYACFIVLAVSYATGNFKD